MPIRMYESGEIDMTYVDRANIERVLVPTNPLHKELATVPKFNVSYIATRELEGLASKTSGKAVPRQREGFRGGSQSKIY